MVAQRLQLADGALLNLAALPGQAFRPVGVVIRGPLGQQGVGDTQDGMPDSDRRRALAAPHHQPPLPPGQGTAPCPGGRLGGFHQRPPQPRIARARPPTPSTTATTTWSGET